MHGVGRREGNGAPGGEQEGATGHPLHQIPRPAPHDLGLAAGEERRGRPRGHPAAQGPLDRLRRRVARLGHVVVKEGDGQVLEQIGMHRRPVQMQQREGEEAPHRLQHGVVGGERHLGVEAGRSGRGLGVLHGQKHPIHAAGRQGLQELQGIVLKHPQGGRQPLGRGAAMGREALGTRQADRHEQGVEDGGHQGDGSGKPLPQRAGGRQDLGPESGEGREGPQPIPVVQLADHGPANPAAADRIPRPGIHQAVVDQLPGGGGGELDEIGAEEALVGEGGPGQGAGPLIVEGMVAPGGHRRLGQGLARQGCLDPQAARGNLRTDGRGGPHPD